MRRAFKSDKMKFLVDEPFNRNTEEHAIYDLLLPQDRCSNHEEKVLARYLEGLTELMLNRGVATRDEIEELLEKATGLNISKIG